jgi:prepilin-type N-terminal cleavage/methylation domain-containing protein
MRATIKNYVEAANRRREEEGEEGFSLIELIIVVVILGILVAIAIPIFSNIQATAQQNAVDAAAADAAVAIAAAVADDTDTTTVTSAIAPYTGNDITITAVGGGALTDASFTTVDSICVQSNGYTSLTGVSGPGCGAADDDE